MKHLRTAWAWWYDILSFEWLERLSRFSPRLAWNLACILWSLWMFAFAWYQLDPRFRIFQKHSYIEEAWWSRILVGSVFLLAGLAPIVFRTGPSESTIELRWNPFKQFAAHYRQRQSSRK